MDDTFTFDDLEIEFDGDVVVEVGADVDPVVDVEVSAYEVPPAPVEAAAASDPLATGTE